MTAPLMLRARDRVFGTHRVFDPGDEIIVGADIPSVTAEVLINDGRAKEHKPRIPSTVYATSRLIMGHRFVEPGTPLPVADTGPMPRLSAVGALVLLRTGDVTEKKP